MIIKSRLLLFFSMVVLALLLAAGISSRVSPPATTEGVITGQTERVTYQARLHRFSSSGDMRFERIERATDSAEATVGDGWFFAQPRSVPSDEAGTEAWVQFIQENQNAVFSISGERLESDCDYYGDDTCVESVEITDIKVIE